MLENAFARFVVCSLHRGLQGRSGGHLIEALPQRGEDRMRLLAPLLGSGPPRRPVYRRLRVQSAGGRAEPAEVVAEGHLAGVPEVRVKTTYRLEPGSKELRLTTEVTNGAADPLRGFLLADQVFHGRTVRFAPGLGLMPRGASGRSPWTAFFGGGQVWGILPVAPSTGVEAAYYRGRSELTFGRPDIDSGEVRVYRRRLRVGFGGPEQVWLAARAEAERELSRLQVAVADEESGAPCSDAWVTVEPEEGVEFLAVPGPDGVAGFALPGGSYRVSATAPGRRGSAPVAVNCVSGMSHRLNVGLKLAAVVRPSVRVRLRDGLDYSVPGAARVAAFSRSRATPPVRVGLGFPTRPARGVLLAGGKGPSSLPLAPADRRGPGHYLVVASRGPLFDLHAVAFAARPGALSEPDMVLQQVADRKGYAAVDFRQRTDASPDCALTPAERALADACEGLDAGVVSDPVFRVRVPGVPPDAECSLVPGFRMRGAAGGAFSLLAAGVPEEPGRAWRALMGTERQTGERLRAARRLFPRALIQVDDPLNPRSGYFALRGWSPADLREAPDGALAFDAVEVLSGGHVERAERMLPYWFALLNAGRRTVATGGSGSRGIGGADAVLARTFIRCPTAGGRPGAERVAEAIRALKQAPAAYVTNGPLIRAVLGSEGIGATLTEPGPTVRLSLRILAAKWVDVGRVTVYRNGRAVETIQVPETRKSLRLETDLELDVPGDCWFVVRVEGERKMVPVYYAGEQTPTPFAVTNPWWVDADGDGAVRPEPGT
ncbi:MAG: hypothetical protein ACOC7T_00630 [Planctomycetota bacterium]